MAASRAETEGSTEKSRTVALLVPEESDGPITRRYRAALAAADVLELEKLILDPVDADTTAPAAPAVALVSDRIILEEDPAKVKEAAIYALAEIISKNNPADLQAAFKRVRPFFSVIPKARTAKVVRSFIDIAATVPGTEAVQEALCLEALEWCEREKRNFLRHRIAIRLALFYQQQKRNQRALEIVHEVELEVKRLDDKLLLIEVYLLDAQLNFASRHLPKAKAALTAARSNATAVHCPPLLQAEIDVLAGAIHLEDRDPKTAFSYFYEALEVFAVASTSRAKNVLKFLMLSKILQGHPEEAVQLLNQKHYLKFIGPDTAAMSAIAESYIQRDLGLFEKALEKFSHDIANDTIVERHVKSLYRKLLGQNILKVLEPFSCVEVSHVASLMNISVDQIQHKLCEMILDKELNASLDQGAGVLTVYDEPEESTQYTDGIKVLENLTTITGLLHRRAEKAI